MAPVAMAHPLSRFRVNNKESEVYDDRQAAVEIVARNAQVCETEPAAQSRRDSRVFMVNVCKIIFIPRTTKQPAGYDRRPSATLRLLLRRRQNPIKSTQRSALGRGKLKTIPFTLSS